MGPVSTWIGDNLRTGKACNQPTRATKLSIYPGKMRISFGWEIKGVVRTVRGYTRAWIACAGLQVKL